MPHTKRLPTETKVQYNNGIYNTIKSSLALTFIVRRFQNTTRKFIVCLQSLRLLAFLTLGLSLTPFNRPISVSFALFSALLSLGWLCVWLIHSLISVNFNHRSISPEFRIRNESKSSKNMLTFCLGFFMLPFVLCQTQDSSFRWTDTLVRCTRFYRRSKTQKTGTTNFKLEYHYAYKHHSGVCKDRP